jgi:hypothetical protein
MLLIDGVRYQEWKPATEAEFERVVKDHTQDIFGEESIYLDLKQKLKIKSESGIGSIPDGYVIILGNQPHWHIVEVELSSHLPHEHIVSQISRFISGIKNPNMQREIAGAIYEEVARDTVLITKAKRVIISGEVYKFISDCVSKPPEITIIIEKNTPELDDAIGNLAPQPRVVEFRTFTNKAPDKPAYAHLFEPLTKQGEEAEFSEYREFLNELRQEIIRRRPQLRTYRPNEYYCKIAVGHQGIHLEWLFHATERKLGVELHLERATHAENSRLVGRLKTRSAELEKSIGETLAFQYVWGKRWSRVYALKEVEWTPEFKQWAVDTMIKFFDAFKTLLDEVDITS